MQKKEMIFVYLPNTSYFMHFQSVRQKKWNIHNKTNKYRWHFRSKPHQTTSLSGIGTHALPGSPGLQVQRLIHVASKRLIWMKKGDS